jgi:hypothetical protein
VIFLSSKYRAGHWEHEVFRRGRRGQRATFLFLQFSQFPSVYNMQHGIVSSFGVSCSEPQNIMKTLHTIIVVNELLLMGETYSLVQIPLVFIKASICSQCYVVWV